MKRNIKPIVLAGISCLLSFGATMASAQMNSPQLRALVINGTDLQRAAGNFIAEICEDSTVNANNGSENIRNISTACNLLADNADDLLGGANVSSDGFTTETLLATIVDVAPEEIAAIASGFTDTAQDQLSSVTSRLDFLRTGASTGLANLQWNNGMTGGAAGDDFSKLGVYVNGNFGTGEKDQTAQENGFDYDAYGLIVGADYRISDALVTGAALSYSDSEVDFNNNGGTTESDGFTITFYGSYSLDDYYFDVVLGFGSHDYDSSRIISVSGVGSQTVSSSTSADSINLSLGAGYNAPMFKLLNRDWSSTVFARLDRVDVDIDGYSENGGFLAMAVSDQEVESLQLIFGGQTSTSISTKNGVWIPYAGLELHFELDDETRVVTAGYVFDELGSTFSFQSDDADSNYGLLSLGTNVVLAKGKQLFINYDRVIGLDDVTAGTITGGIRFEL